MRKDKFKVCIMGASLDTGNMGVSALTASITKIILQNIPESAIFLFIGNRSSQPQELNLSDRKIKLNVINFRLSPKAKLNEHIIWIFLLAILQRIIPVKLIQKNIIKSNYWLHNLSSCDFIADICGGDSFSDIYGIRLFFYTIFADLIVLLMKKKLVLLPQTYGPYNSFISKRIARYIMRRSEYIYARDKEGLSVVKKIVGNSHPTSNLSFCPDVAFMLDSILPEKQDIEPRISISQQNGLIGININGLLYNGGYSRDNMFGLELDYQEFVERLLDRLLEITSVHILIVPHTFCPPDNINDDLVASNAVYNAIDLKFRNRIHRVMREYNQHEIKGIIGQCDFFVGSRMHSCIAALAQNIPTVGVAYSRKFIGVFESIGVGDLVVDARTTNRDDALETVINCYQSREEYIYRIRDNVRKAKDLITNTFNSLLIE